MGWEGGHFENRRLRVQKVMRSWSFFLVARDVRTCLGFLRS